MFELKKCSGYLLRCQFRQWLIYQIYNTNYQEIESFMVRISLSLAFWKNTLSVTPCMPSHHCMHMGIQMKRNSFNFIFCTLTFYIISNSTVKQLLCCNTIFLDPWIMNLCIYSCSSLFQAYSLNLCGIHWPFKK